MQWWGGGVALLVCCCAGLVVAATVQEEEEDLEYYLSRLYEAGGSDLGPHNMLAYPGKPALKAKTEELSSFDSQSDKEELSRGSCGSEAEVKHIEKQLSMCEGQVNKLETALEDEQQKVSVLHQRMRTENSLDMEAFYKRSVHHMWNTLQLEEAQSILDSSEGSAAVVRHLTVHVTRDHLTALHRYLHHHDRIHQVDEFFEQAFTLHSPPVMDSLDIVHSAQQFIASIFEVGKNVETWLYVLCVGFLMLAAWAMYLFVRDIQRELRWGRVLSMMTVLTFFICCLWHWRHMHKVAESRRHAQMMKRGFSNNIPEECKPGHRSTSGSVLEWIKVNVLGSPDVCERYFEELMIDPTQEITPAMVIAETLAKFFLQPLQHLGSESAKLITNFYGHVPVVYHLPATAFFLVLLVIILFYVSGYGIDFPLWMGGIRPHYRPAEPAPPSTAQVDRVTQEAIAQLNQERETFMQQSRSMLADISRAAGSLQARENTQPLMLLSNHILEQQLERLISRTLETALNDQNSTAHDHKTSGHGTARRKPGIYTVKSTPLRHHSEDDDSSSNSSTCRSEQGGRKDWSSDMPVVLSREKSGAIAKRTVSPSKTQHNSSSDSSSVSLSSQANNKHPQKHKGDVPDHNKGLLLSDTQASSSGSDFYSDVCHVLEDSLNSSSERSHRENVRRRSSGGGARRLIRSTNTGVQEEEEDQEVELSASGVKFLKAVEKSLHPDE